MSKRKEDEGFPGVILLKYPSDEPDWYIWCLPAGVLWPIMSTTNKGLSTITPDAGAHHSLSLSVRQIDPTLQNCCMIDYLPFHPSHAMARKAAVVLTRTETWTSLIG